VTAIGKGLHLWMNTNLRNVDDLSSVESIHSLISIVGNFHLLNLNGLCGMTSFTGSTLSVRLNNDLRECCSLQWLLMDGDIEHVSINLNGEGCYAPDEILPPRCPQGCLTSVQTSTWGNVKRLFR
jgi:hypothetical protein